VRALSVLFSAALIATWLTVGIASQALADPPTCPSGETPSEIPGGWICIPVTDPGDPGGVGAVPDTANGGVGSSQCLDEGAQVPCVTAEGVWFASQNCYASQVTPQPGPDSGAWLGHDPSAGSLWSCTNTPSSSGFFFFVPDGQAALVNPATLAQSALEQMQLERANAQIAPGPDFHTYVHIDNWMWVPEEQWHTLQRTVSAGPTSVAVTAEPDRVDWEMGTETVACYDAGREWVKGMTDAAKTTCSYAYDSIEDPTGDTYDVVAQIVYGVTWTCSGACLSQSGDLGDVAAPPGATTTIEVRQRQTVVTN
jgi:hypothetical protein